MMRLIWLSLLLGSTRIDSTTSLDTENGGPKVIDDILADFNEIDEQLVDIFDPDWMLQTKTVDPGTGVVTMKIYKEDKSEKVTRVAANWKGCCLVDGIWRDWTRKTKKVDAETGKITESVSLDGGIEQISEFISTSGRTRETVLYPHGTRIRETDAKSGQENRTAIYGQESRVEAEKLTIDSFETRLANVTLFYPNGTVKIVTIHPDSGFKNSTTIHADGAKEISEIDPSTGTLISTEFLSNGTLKSRKIDDVIEERFIDFLHPDWTRLLKQGDTSDGSVIVTVFDSHGTETVRKIKNVRRSDPDWVEKVKKFDRINGIETRTTMFTNGAREVETNTVPNSKVEITSFSLAAKSTKCDDGFSPDARGRCREIVQFD